MHDHKFKQACESYNNQVRSSGILLTVNIIVSGNVVQSYTGKGGNNVQKTMEKELVCEIAHELAREARLEEKINEAFFIAWIKSVIYKLDKDSRLAS